MPKIRKSRSEFKWKSLFRFFPTGIFGITSGGGPLISVGILRSKFAVPFLTNRFSALIRKFGRGIKRGKGHSYCLARFNRKMPFHFPRVFPLISDSSVCHNLMGSTLNYRNFHPPRKHTRNTCGTNLGIIWRINFFYRSSSHGKAQCCLFVDKIRGLEIRLLFCNCLSKDVQYFFWDITVLVFFILFRQEEVRRQTTEQTTKQST